MKSILFVTICLLFSTVLAATPFEVFYSQAEVVSPCTGSVVTFDFGKIELQMQKAGDNFTIDAKIFSTLRYEGQLYTQNGERSFTISLPEKDGLRTMSIKSNGDAIPYILKLGVTARDDFVNSVLLNDVEIASGAGCKAPLAG